MIIFWTALAVLLLLSLISDVITYKVKNIIIYPFVVVGLLLNLFCGKGLSAVVSSLLGIVIPVLLLWMLYALRMLGAGDIKLFSAIGAVMGVSFALYSIAYSFLLGGILAFIVLLRNKNRKQRLHHLFSYFKDFFLSGRLTPYTDFNEKNDGSKFHFSYAICLGTVFTLMMQTL